MHSRSIAILSILILAAAISCRAAENSPSDWFYRAWQTEDGLPDNSISGIAQAPDGYLWLGTNGGAIRFNGTQFVPLPLRDIPGLPSRQVRAMFIDQTGRIWLAMERGPVLCVGENTFLSFDHTDGLLAKVTMGMTDDPDGRLWIAYASGVCFIDNGEVTRVPDAPQGLLASITRDANGQIWFANGGKLGRLSENGFDLVRDFDDLPVRITSSHDNAIWLTAGPGLMSLEPGGRFTSVAQLPEDVAVNAIYEDSAGAVWIGTQRAGLLRAAGGALEKVATSHAWVECISQDREGNIWAGTRGGGLNLIRHRAVDFVGKTDGLPFYSVRSTACDRSGQVWSVSQDGRLSHRTPEGWRLYPGFSELGLANCVAADQQGRVWVGTRKQGVLQIDGDQLTWFRDGLASLAVRSLLTTRNGDVWIATDRPDRLHRLRGGKISPLDHAGTFTAIRALAEGPDGTVWAGSADGRLLRVDGDRLVDESTSDKRLSLSIRTLHTTKDGSLWIGYAGDGLGHLKDGRYRRITSEAGLYDDYVTQIQDDGGALWIAANRGLFQVNLDELLGSSDNAGPPQRLKCRVFGSNDGVPSIQPSRDYAPTTCRSPDGRLFFPTHSGIVEVDPGQITDNPLPPNVVIERVSLDNKTVALYKSRSVIDVGAKADQTDLRIDTPRLELPPGHDKLVVEIAALSLTSPENVQIRYRLKPIDENWEEVENRRSVTFSRLPAGGYTFQAIACNNAGVWNQTGASLGIVVHPFFWETWWFRVGGGFFTAFAAAGLAFLGLRRKHRRQLQEIAAKRALEQERTRIARDIHDDLGASLTRITLLSQQSPHPGAPPAGGVLDQIHTTSRHLMRSMEEVVWAVNPEHDTFDALANYISNYGQGFLSVAGVRCRLQMPMSLPEHPLSAQIRHNLFLAFKEALNNAVKHAAASEVRITLELENDAFVLRVEDNGEGIDPDAPAAPMRPNPGSGLANMKNRMGEIGGTCTLDSTLGKGTTIEFNVPFKINS